MSWVAEEGQGKKSFMLQIPTLQTIISHNINQQNRLCKNYKITSSMSNDLITANISA